MNTTQPMEEHEDSVPEYPGATLARARELKGYSVSYIAEKLHLRVRVVELLESDDYENMPEPVFIKGYLRAYATLLDLPPAPIVDTFNQLFDGERKMGKSLWQSRREPHKAENLVRWMTVFLTVAVVVAVSLWWHANKDNERFFKKHVSNTGSVAQFSDSEIRLTDLSNMRSLLSSKPDDVQTGLGKRG